MESQQTYVIETRGEARELYTVVAESEDQARELFARGETGPPWLTEVYESEIIDIRPDS